MVNSDSGTIHTMGKKTQTTDRQDHMDESEDFIKWMMLDTNDYIKCYFIYMRFKHWSVETENQNNGYLWGPSDWEEAYRGLPGFWNILYLAKVMAIQ